MPTEAEALAAFERAGEHGEHGEDAAAIPEYERALALGLDADERCAALLGLGNALRNVGRHDEAVRVFRAAVGEFPDHAPLRAFFALALHARGEAREAMLAMLDLVLRYAPVGGFAETLSEYRGTLERAVADDDGWRGLVAKLTRHEFARTFPIPFLLEVGARLGTKIAEDPGEETSPNLRIDLVELAATNAPPPLILGVRKLGNQVPSAVSVGRLVSNDVSIRDRCVSKIHAFFRPVGDGRWELSDAGSHNGTWIGNRRLEPKGEALPVRAGDVLSFGRTGFFFLDAGGLWDKLRAR